jgi:integrase
VNPVIGVKKPTKETTRDRVLTEDDIRRLWEACATQNALRVRVVPNAAGYGAARRRAAVFPKTLMGDCKHVGRRLAQSTRANIVIAPKREGAARARADIRGHDLRRTAASFMASGGVFNCRLTNS